MFTGLKRVYGVFRVCRAYGVSGTPTELTQHVLLGSLGSRFMSQAWKSPSSQVGKHVLGRPSYPESPIPLN